MSGTGDHDWPEVEDQDRGKGVNGEKPDDPAAPSTSGEADSDAEAFEGLVDELERRKVELGLTVGDCELLRSTGEIIAPFFAAIVESFVDHRLKLAHRNRTEFDVRRIDRVCEIVCEHLDEIFRARFAIEYVRSRERFATAHFSLGIAPEMRVVGIYHLQALLIDRICQLLAGEHERAVAVQRALHKAMMLDIQFTVDRQMRELEAASRTDPLTDLGNMRMLSDSLEREISRSRRYRRPMTVVFIDLNGFKAVNDTSGHKAGDNVLRLLGAKIRQNTRLTDVACRYGGDEFVLVLAETPASGAVTTVERIAEHFGEEVEHPVTLAIGIVEQDILQPVDAETLLARADQAMYRAKSASYHSHRGEIVIWGDRCSEGERP
ncbi:MAG: GGDEF domain-containing protein [Geminicoccaceae bacterium]